MSSYVDGGALQLAFEIWHWSRFIFSLSLIYFCMLETTSALNHRRHAGKIASPSGQSLIINLLERSQKKLNFSTVA